MASLVHIPAGHGPGDVAVSFGADPLRVAYLKEFQRGLKKVDGELGKELRKGFNEVADVIVADTRRRVPVRTGKARASVKVASTQTAAAVAWGGRKAPYYPWLEFGGTVGRGRVSAGNKQRAGGRFGDVAGSVKRTWKPGGRYLYPSIKANRDEMLDVLDDVIVRLFKKAGWD